MSLARTETRRRFLADAGRWVVAGVLGLGTLRLVAGSAEACSNGGACAGCAELAHCPRPEAEAALRRRTGGES